ncbi:MAG: DEAD/DEAH box helicase [Polyangiales bacterium]
MTLVKLAKFTDDADDVLRDVKNAAFAREHRLPGATALDFTGVAGVTLAFLDELFRGRSPESLLELEFPNTTPDVDATLSRWLDRSSAPPLPKAPQRAAMPTVASRPAEIRFAAADDPGEKYTPTRLARRLRDQLRGYLEAAWPLNDTRLVHARRALFETAAGGHLLAQDPYVETTPRYTAAEEGFGDLGMAAPTAAFFEATAAAGLIYPSLYAHQAAALRAFLGPARRDLVVATGTGSGKTECFLLPLVGMLHEEARTQPEGWKKRGVRALILYPMNALVNDQVSRLRRLLGDEGFAARFRDDTGAARHPVFGMYTGRTPYAGPRDGTKDKARVLPLLEWYQKLSRESPEAAAALRKRGRYPAKDLDAFLADEHAEEAAYKSGKRKGQKYTKHHWDRRLLTGAGDRELITRHEMVRDEDSGQGSAPDVLVTNYSMLEYMLMRPFERPVFEETRRWLAEPGSRFLLVLDEAHMYRGAKGAEVAFLLRRLFDRLGVTDHPEKVSVIATSASLGGSGDATDIARRFAADLTGLAPDRFDIVTGRRQPAVDPRPGDAATASVLASVDLDALHGARSADALRAATAAVFAHLGASPPDGDEAQVLAALHHLLAPQPFVQQLLHETSAKARSLAALAEAVFPGTAEARRATEALLTLGAVARTAPDEPSLLPTRIHLMFRGIDGLYACLNPRCSGRQHDPGEVAPLGRLFAEARTFCDACDSRVFEVASCRECGSAYCLAYAPSRDLDGWDFLWGEAAEADGVQVQLLPGTPRPGHDLEVLSVQLRTGKLLGATESAAAHETRDLWIAHHEGRRAPEFTVCAVCQPAGSQRKGRIKDHRTRGEQPFTALVEAQFAEQPPQSDRDDLPNRGRKVLVFSDGRQKAARLAPSLAVGHAQDAFRQVLVLAAREFERRGEGHTLAMLYPAILHVCRERSVDLFPEGAGTGEWARHLAMASSNSFAQLLNLTAALQPPEAYAQALFNEVTERFLSVTQLGVATLGVAPSIAPLFLKDFPRGVLSDADARLLFDRWIRVQLERRCFLPPNASPGRLGEEFQRPAGITPGRPLDLLPQRFQDYLRAVVPDDHGRAAVVRWIEGLPRTGLFVFFGDQHFLVPQCLTLRLRREGPWWMCERCHRVHGDDLGARCDDCGGDLAPADPSVLSARAGYYRDAVLRALDGSSIEPFGLTVKEHTAQLTGLGSDDEAFNLTEQYELRFQDLRVDGAPPIDVLSCTTTMEVGIDIGSLSGVALRNVPPHVANYQQRAGRAGRRGRAIASVVTYAQGGSHDAWYYDLPSRIVSGDVRAPVVYVENVRVLRRHAFAWLLQRFFHETVPSGSAAYALFESMGTVRDFLDARQPCSLARMASWLEAHEARLMADLARWVPRVAHGAGAPVDVDAALRGAVPELLRAVREALPVDDAAQLDALDDVRRAAVELRLDENLLQTLIERAVLPRYAFPTDTVAFWVPRPRHAGTPKWKTEFEYQPQRDLQVALTEYAPGRTLTIDGFRFTSAALYNPYQPEVARTLARQTPYAACKRCGYVGKGGQVEALPACPVCGDADLFRRRFVRPEGFAPDVNARREPDRGGTVSWAGETTPARLEVVNVDRWDDVRYDGRLRVNVAARELIVVNKGVGDRGFMICRQCGLAEPTLGVGFSAPAEREGRVEGPREPDPRGRHVLGDGGGPALPRPHLHDGRPPVADPPRGPNALRGGRPPGPPRRARPRRAHVAGRGGGARGVALAPDRRG